MNRMIHLVGVAAWLLVLSVAAEADVTLLLESQIRGSVGARSAQLVDTDHDGDLDLLFVSPEQGVLSVLQNDSDIFDGDMFSFDRRDLYEVGEQPTEIGIGDLDADGMNDVVVASREDDVLVVFLMKEPGVLVESVRLATAEGPYDVIVEDLNGDGHNDILVGERADDSFAVFISHGDGYGFEKARRYNAVNETRQIALGDFNGDGNKDLAVAGEELQIFLGNSGGEFNREQAFDLDDVLQALVTADLNGDGFDDLVVTGLSQQQVYVLHSAGAQLFSDDENDGRIGFMSTEMLPNVIAAGDVDQDGLDDVIVASRSSAEFYVLEGSGEWGFVIHRMFADFEGIASVALGDIDRDGRIDVTATSAETDLINLYRGMERVPYDVVLDVELGGQLDQIALLDPDDSAARVLVADVKNDVFHVIRVTEDDVSVLSQVPAEITPFNLQVFPWGDTPEVLYSPTTAKTVARFRVGRDNNGTALSPIVLEDDVLVWNAGRFSDAAARELFTVSATGTARLLELDESGAAERAVKELGFIPYLGATADLDGDGRDELLLAGDELAVAEIATGEIVVGERFSLPVLPESLRALDVDSDGDLDVSLLDSDGNTVMLYVNDAGHLTAGQETAVHSEQRPIDLAVPDLDGDGIVDLAVAVKEMNYINFYAQSADRNYRQVHRLKFEDQPAHLLAVPASENVTPLLVSFGTEPFLKLLARSDNRQPLASDLVFEVNSDDVLVDNLVGQDPDGDSLGFVITTPPPVGKLELLDSHAGRFAYTPEQPITLEDVHFQYVVTDGALVSAEATAKIQVDDGGGGGGMELLLVFLLGTHIMWGRRKVRD